MAMLYTVKENGWCEQLARDLYTLMNEEKFCDTEIITGDGKRILAHANVLAARSKLLKNTFESSLTPSFKVQTEQISAKTWNPLLRFMYLGQLSADYVDFQEVSEAAESLEMSSLMDACKEHLEQIRPQQLAAKQEYQATQETQTEDVILKFASGELETLNFEDDTIATISGLDPQQFATDTSVGGIVHGEDVGAELTLEACPVEDEATRAAVAQAVTEYTPQHDSTSEISAGRFMQVVKEDGVFMTRTPIQKNVHGQLDPEIDSTTEIHAPLPGGITRKNQKQSRLLQKDMLFKCGICDKFFANKQGLERHAILHTPGHAYTCKLCRKSFKLERYLTAHMQRHSDERKYQCSVCGKSFKTQRDASWHTKTVHTDEKRHHCELCNYVAKTKNLLAQHMVMHTNEKSFACGTCGKTFLRKQHLLQHQQRHDGKREYLCSTCGAEFYTVYACKEHHMRIHQGLKKYECSICGQQYNEKKSFMKHLQKHSVDMVLTLDGQDVVVDPKLKSEFVTSIVAGEQYSVMTADGEGYETVRGLDNVVTMEEHSAVMDDVIVPMDDSTVIHSIATTGNSVVTEIPLPTNSTVVQYRYVSGDEVPVDKYIEEAVVSL